jgi:hypothetical protein
LLRHEVLPRLAQARHGLALLRVQPDELPRRAQQDELLRRVQPDELPRRAQPAGLPQHVQLAGPLRHALRPGHALPVNAADSEDGFPDAPRLHHG